MTPGSQDKGKDKAKAHDGHAHHDH
jgi:hypothetical protein